MPQVDLVVPQDNLIARYEKLHTGAISDVLREHCLLDQALSGPLRPERTVAGVAFAVKSAPSTKITGELTFHMQRLADMPPGSFVVCEASRDMASTAWGDVMTATAIGKGIRTAVIDGGIRDTNQSREKDFLILYRCRSPNGSLGRCQIPVKFGTVFVRPGAIAAGRHRRRDRRAADHRGGRSRMGRGDLSRRVTSGGSLEEITGKGGSF